MSFTSKEISVIGSGYVGVTTAAIAANAGFKVHLIDINPKRIEVLKTGKSFFYEEGINPLIKHGIDSGTLIPSTSYDGVSESSIVFSCVGTPDNPDGSSNLEYVFAAAKTAGPLMNKNTIFVQKSTVPVGTGKRIIRELSKDILYVSNPEFLREGTAVYDTLFFDRVVCGGKDNNSLGTIISFYKQIENHRDSIAKRANITTVADVGKYIKTNLESAELMKVTSNAFLALKISFANSIAKLADESGANVVEVMEAVGADKRIGPAFFNAGRGYGGGCFPKDVSGLISSASEHGVDMPIMTAAQEVNDSMPGYIIRKIQKEIGETLKDKKITVLGLSFKAGTSDVRKSPGIKIANILASNQANVSVYDPHANDEASLDLLSSIKIFNNPQEASKLSEAIIIATEWEELLNLDFNNLKKIMNGNLVVDAVNRLSPSIIKATGLKYLGVGKR